MQALTLHVPFGQESLQGLGFFLLPSFSGDNRLAL